MIELRIFIDTCFTLGSVEGLKPDDVKKYLRYIANKRLSDLNLEAKYDIEENPLPWMNLMVNEKSMLISLKLVLLSTLKVQSSMIGMSNFDSLI